jgi:hypothetical protein
VRARRDQHDAADDRGMEQRGFAGFVHRQFSQSAGPAIYCLWGAAVSREPRACCNFRGRFGVA